MEAAGLCCDAFSPQVLRCRAIDGSVPAPPHACDTPTRVHSLTHTHAHVHPLPKHTHITKEPCVSSPASLHCAVPTMQLPCETPISIKVILLQHFKFQFNYLLVCLYNGYPLIDDVFLSHSFSLFFLLFWGRRIRVGRC